MATPGQIKMEKRLSALEEKVQLLMNTVLTLNRLMEYHHGTEKQADNTPDQNEQNGSDTEHDAVSVSDGGGQGMEQDAPEEGDRGKEPDKQSQRRGRKEVPAKASSRAGGSQERNDH
jgi:hypothetical protein